MIYDYLKAHHIKDLCLAFGASLGGVVLHAIIELQWISGLGNLFLRGLVYGQMRPCLRSLLGIYC